MLAIEPMVNLGAAGVRTLADRWTVVTADREVAHFEHTVAMTANGPRVLTRLGRASADTEPSSASGQASKLSIDRGRRTGVRSCLFKRKFQA